MIFPLNGLTSTANLLELTDFHASIEKQSDQLDLALGGDLDLLGLSLEADGALTIDVFPTVAALIGAKLPDHKIDGHDIREFTRHDLRQMFAMVLQDTWLYNGTIMENIRYGRLEASDERLAA